MGVRAVTVALVLVSGVATSAADDAAPLAYDEALHHAGDLGLPLVMEFGASWCGPCKVFAAKTLPDPRVKTALNDVVFVSYDAEAAPGSAAAAKFHVDAFPTFVIVDKGGVERYRQTGAPGPDAFLVLLAKARDVTVGEEALLERVRAKPGDAKAKLTLAKWYLRGDRIADALAQLDAIVALRGAPADIAAEAKNGAARLRRIDRWKRELLAEKVAAIRASPATALEDDLIVATIGSSMSAAERRKLFHDVLAAQTDDDRLNGAIYVALAAGELDESLAAAEKLVARKREAKYLDTLAECHHMRHESKEAILVGREAIGVAGGADLDIEDELSKNVARFESGSGETNDVKQKRLRSAELWKRIATVDVLPERASDPDVEARRRSAQEVYLAQRAAQRTLTRAIEKACRRDAGKTELALVRVELDRTSHIASMKVLVEAGAPKELAGCIGKQLAGAVVASAKNQRSATLSLSFKPGKTRADDPEDD